MSLRTSVWKFFSRLTYSRPSIWNQLAKGERWVLKKGDNYVVKDQSFFNFDFFATKLKVIRAYEKVFIPKLILWTKDGANIVLKNVQCFYAVNDPIKYAKVFNDHEALMSLLVQNYLTRKLQSVESQFLIPVNSEGVVPDAIENIFEIIDVKTELNALLVDKNVRIANFVYFGHEKINIPPLHLSPLSKFKNIQHEILKIKSKENDLMEQMDSFADSAKSYPATLKFVSSLSSYEEFDRILGSFKFKCHCNDRFQSKIGRSCSKKSRRK